MAFDPSYYAGSASFFPGDTPFGYYDNDPQFQVDAERVTNYCAVSLGFPVVDIELSQLNFFAAFEAATNEYGNQVNSYAARDNIFNLLGFDTGSQDLNQRYIEPSLRSIFRLAKQYGSQVGAGGNLTWFSGSITLTANKQVYNLLTDATLETGSFSTDDFTIRRIYHEAPPSSVQYLDPYGGSGLGSQAFLGEFGFGGMSAGGNFLMTPLNFDVMRVQAIEFNEQIRKSAYSFQLTRNRLKIFPIPTETIKVWFAYTLDAESNPGGIGGEDSGGDGKISDHSNIPYGRLVYRYINEIGRQWIRKYTLALCKEMLANVRGKYQNIPVPDEDTTLNYADLLSAAQDEKRELIEQLTELLDQMSRQAQLERKQAESDMLSQQLAKVPNRIYIG